ncbi:MAG: hypothetical protein ACRCZI_02810, partial [Cetobacterium sp.]
VLLTFVIFEFPDLCDDCRLSCLTSGLSLRPVCPLFMLTVVTPLVKIGNIYRAMIHWQTPSCWQL